MRGQQTRPTTLATPNARSLGCACVVLIAIAGGLNAQIQLNPPTQPRGTPNRPSQPPTAEQPTSQNPQFRFATFPNQPQAPSNQQPLTQPQPPANLQPQVNLQPQANLQLQTNPPAQTAVQTTPQSPQTPRAEPVSDAISITPEAVNNRLQQFQAAADLDPTLKQTLIATYEAILAELKSRVDSEKVIKEFTAAFDAAPAATAEAKKRRENPRPRIVFTEGTLQSTSRIETLQNYQLEVQALAQAATDGRVRVETAIVSRDTRRKELATLLANNQITITKLNNELALPANDGIDPRVREANTLLLRAKLMALAERNRSLEQEQRTYDAEQELLPITKEVLLAEEKFQQARLKEVNDELSKRREILIENQRSVAKGLVQQAAPELKKTAELIVKRTEDWLELAKQNSSIRLDAETAGSELKLWAERFKIMSDRISTKSSKHVPNFNSWVGLMLRKQRNELPDIGHLSQRQVEYQNKMLSTQTLLFEFDDLKAKSAFSVDSTQPSAPNTNILLGFERAPPHEQKRMLDAIEHRIVDDFRRDASIYFDNLFNLALTNQKTIDQVRQYRSFIDEHVLWIRSSEPINKSDFRQLWPSIQWLFDLQNWRLIPLQLWKDMQTHPWGYLFGGCCYGTLLLNLKRFKKHIQAQGAIATKSNCTQFLPTAKVVLDCILLSLPLALLHLILGWRLMATSEGNAFVESIATGLFASARYFYPLEMIRQISRSGGLAENHFQWPSRSTQMLRKNLRWFIDLAIPAVTVVGIISQFGETKWENSLGRLTYCVLMSLCFLYLLILLHPRNGVFSDFLSRNAGGWIDRLKYLWYSAFAIAPLALMGMSLMGYHYTAIRLTMLLYTTFITMVGILLLSSLIHRWLLLRRREIVVSQARQRLEEARRRDPGASPSNTPVTLASAVDARSELAQISAQTIRLIRSTLVFATIAALAFIWSGVLPAVGVLESVQLWTVESATADKPSTWITLADLFVAIPIAIMTAVAARNLPGLLEIALLQHLPLENAVRYAIASLSRYTLLILGVALTFNSLGVRWASIQWLVAALGVGLGFGLQEIFANFVSGLILLFEQPIRVGDVITLGDTTGSVSRIRMRATTVTNFDQQELIIPNKDLITGRLLNWTLSDSTNRMVIAVGVSYDSDPELACSLLREVCSNHPNVMSEPPATAFFEQFGDSTLDLKARFFLANLDQRLPTRHDLHSQIKQRFAEAGIEISFPQRDLHLRSVPKDLAAILRNENLTAREPKIANEPPHFKQNAKPATSNGRVQGD